MARINAGNVYKLSGYTVIGSAAIGSVTYGLLKSAGFEPDYWVTIGLVETVIHTPILFAAADSLRRELGERKPATVSGLNFAGNTSRIPLTTQNGTKHILAYMMPGSAQKAIFSEPEMPDAFTVSDGDNQHTILAAELEDFYRAAWRRQRNGLAPLARKYFTHERRPRIHRTRYDTMVILLDTSALVLDRGVRRSGRLWLPPLAAMDTLSALAQ